MLSASIALFPREPLGEISPFLHGLSLETLGDNVDDGVDDNVDSGVWVGENSEIPHHHGVRHGVFEALRQLEPPVIRWPDGGDTNWRDGIGANRPRRVTSRGGKYRIESNDFGTHEFLRLCRDIGAQGFIGGNAGTGTPRELAQWVEYCNFASGSSLSDERAANGDEMPFEVPFWGIGSRSSNSGGGDTPASYAAKYRQFESAFPRFAEQNPFLIAVGPDGNQQSSAKWTRQLLQHLGEWSAPRLHGLDARFITSNAQSEFGDATQFSLDEYYGLLSESLKIEALIDEQRALLDASPLGRETKLIIGQWGICHPPGERLGWQQNTLRDAISAAMTLDLFGRKSGSLTMALGQTVDIGQSLLHTFGDQTIKTPTYHVFDLYKRHRGGQLIHSQFESGEAGGLPRLSGSASLQNGVVTLSVVNTGARSPVEATISLPGSIIEQVAAKELTGDGLGSQNSLEAPDLLTPREIAPNFDALSDKSSFEHTFAPASVTVFLIQLSS